MQGELRGAQPGDAFTSSSSPGLKGEPPQPLAPRCQLRAGCELHFFTHLGMLETDGEGGGGVQRGNRPHPALTSMTHVQKKTKKLRLFRE